MTSARADLERLVRIPSVAFAGFPAEPVRQAADATADILQSVGFQNVRLLDIPNGQPAVFGEVVGPPGSATVLLYAHYDVQPARMEDGWTTPAFEPTFANGRLRGRGAADDKSGIIIHAAALRAFAGSPPVGLKVIVEGEEETGGGQLEHAIPGYRDLLAADVIVVADSGNWKLGEPTLTSCLRGMAKVTVEVRTLDHAVHSGLFGGPAPDALVALIKMLNALYDDAGNLVIPGLRRWPWDGLAYPEADFRADASVLPGVTLAGTGSISEQLWTGPAATIIGLDAPPVAGAPNAVVPFARATIAMRTPPQQSTKVAIELLIKHLESVVPWNARATIRRDGTGAGFAADVSTPAYDAARRAMTEAYGKPPVLMGSGGSIPLISVFANNFPGASILLWGAEDNDAGIHSPNEGVDLDELERAILTEALFLQVLAESQQAK